MFGSRGLGQFACQRPRCLGPGPSPLHVGRIEQGEEEEGAHKSCSIEAVCEPVLAWDRMFHSYTE